MTQLHYLGSRGEITPFGNEAWAVPGLLPALATLIPAQLGCCLLCDGAMLTMSGFLKKIRAQAFNSAQTLKPCMVQEDEFGE